MTKTPRLALAILGLAAGCAGAPPPPPPEPAPIAPAPIAPAPPPAEIGEPDLVSTGKVVSRSGDGRELWSATFDRVLDMIARRDGGAIILADSHKGHVVRLDPAGKKVWSVEIDNSHSARLLPMGSPSDADERVLLLDPGRDGGLVELLRVEDGVKERTLHASAARAAPDGGLVIASREGIAKLDAEGRTAWSVRARLFPATEPSAQRGPARRLAMGGGLVLAGAADGSILAVSSAGRPRFQLGVRGGVRGIEARPGGDFVITTSAGVITAIDPEGRVRWETWLGPEAVSPPAVLPDGGVIVTTANGAIHALSAAGAPLWHEPLEVDADRAPRLTSRAVVVKGLHVPLADTHPKAPEIAPTITYRVERMRLGSVIGVVANRPDEAFVLDGSPHIWPTQPPPHLHRWDGKKLHDLGAPKVRLAPEVFVEGGPKQAGVFHARSLGRGPHGEPVIVGARDYGLTDASDSPGDIAVARAAMLIEWSNGGFHERRELFELLKKVPQNWRIESGDARYAASAGGKELLCVADTCLSFGAGSAPAARPRPTTAGPTTFIGETLWRGGAESGKWAASAIMRGSEIAFTDRDLEPLPGVLALWGSSDADVWALHGAPSAPLITRLRRGHAELVQSPIGPLYALWGSAADDVWIGGERGAARFDGQRWSRILDIPGRVTMITGSSRDDVWIGTTEGLFHVTRIPGAEPDLAATPAPAPPPITTASRALPAATNDPSYRLERVTLSVERDAPLKRALGVSEGPGGVVWLHDDRRVVAIEGDKARTIAAPKRGDLLSCQRCLAPSSAGDGVALFPDLRRIAGGKLLSDSTPLPPLVAVARSSTGAIWAVTATSTDDLPHLAVVGARGPRLVPAAPAATYSDISARADDDVWMVGGLASASDDQRTWPEGEGVLAHFDGRAFTRHRAPDGALLAVTAAGAGEAWAAGVAGSIVHAKAGAIDALRLSPEGSRPAPILRAVTTSARGEVWIAGDDATLIRWDGRALHRIDTAAAGPHAAFTGVVAPGDRPGWLVGPGGVYRIVPVK
jgi:outer membrane protein assembly factor BamB